MRIPELKASDRVEYRTTWDFDTSLLDLNTCLSKLKLLNSLVLMKWTTGLHEYLKCISGENVELARADYRTIWAFWMHILALKAPNGVDYRTTWNFETSIVDLSKLKIAWFTCSDGVDYRTTWVFKTYMAKIKTWPEQTTGLHGLFECIYWIWRPLMEWTIRGLETFIVEMKSWSEKTTGQHCFF